MSGLVARKAHGSLSQLTFQNGQDNALSASLCLGLMAALDRDLMDPDIAAILILSQGPVFSAGLDLAWLDQDETLPELRQLCAQLETASKPVIMALHGDAIGAAFELALCAHYRIAAPKVRVGLPGITLDLPPVAGASQRLPRLIGAEATLQMLLSGGTITGAALGPVFDAEITADFAEGARQFAMGLIADISAEPPKAPTPSAARIGGFADPFAYQTAIQEAAPRAAAIGQVGRDILASVEAAPLLPFTAGLDLEQDHFAEHVAAPRARALRHMRIAEVKLAHQAQSHISGTQKLDHLAIIGATPTGLSLAARCLLDGLTVTLVAVAAEPLSDIKPRMMPYLADALKLRAEDPAKAADYLEDLEIDTELEACAGSDLVVDASQDKPELKLRIFEDLGYVLPAHTVLASTSSRVPLADCAKASGRPQQLIGLHLPMPVHSRTVMELCQSAEASSFATSLAAQLAQSLNKSLITLDAIPGQSGAALLAAQWEMTDHLLRSGAGITQIDTAMRALGFAQGPCQSLDQRGIRAALLLAKQLHHGITEDLPVLSALSAEGLLGQRAGQGFYDHPAQTENPKAQELIAALQIPSDRPSDTEIQSKIMAAMANAGARLLREGIAQTPADIDILMVKGHAVPRALGGPMHAADATGLLACKNQLTGGGTTLTPDPLLLDLIKNGQSFADLNS